MLTKRKLRVDDKYITAFCVKLPHNNFIGLVGKKGYIMCGYLNLKAANKFKDTAVKITGVSTIEEALEGRVHSLTHQAKKAGISKGQAVKDVIKIIA